MRLPARELSLNAAADRVGMAWHTLERLALLERKVTCRVQQGPRNRRIYVPVSEVQRLRGVVYERKG